MRRAAVVILITALAGIAVGNGPASASPLWSECGKLRYARNYCSSITSNSVNSRVIAYRDSIQNLRSRAISASCSASQSKTVKWSVGASLETEIKTGIFGGIKGEINASVERETTTGYVTSATFGVPAHDTVHCDRGVVKEVVRGSTRIMDGPHVTSQGWTAFAPEAARWWIY